MQIIDGAIFVADAHFNDDKRRFRYFLEQILDNKISPTQLFLVGDIFDFLTNTTKIQEIFSYEISLINEISSKIPTFYFEGNHDFNLDKIFTNAKVFSINSQPVKFMIGDKTALISHGDNHINFISLSILKILRNKALLKVLDFIDLRCNYKITNFILNSQKNKKLDFKIPKFDEFIHNKVSNYKADFIIEGHFHQDKIFNFKNFTYINLNSFAIKNFYYKLELSKNSINFVQIPLNSI